MRAHKILLREALGAPDWRERLEQLTAKVPRSFVGPLLSCLLQGGTPAGRAAAALGACVAAIAQETPEDARAIMRRFMWHMNEESGNLGWGIPESMAETLARSALLAKEFSRVLLSYIRDTGREDNFVDHMPLRRSCYWAVGRLLQARPELAAHALPLLRAGLRDEDVPCRGMAAWALAQAGVPEDARPELEALAADGESAATPVSVFDGDSARECTVAGLARLALST
ncbi:MAG: HEAT repeat domain-containing protein [Desulfovibrionaceae bacterium]|nr:HEAT repeat domain-containing protein [Desulfovibrionaceae bacterium]